MHTASTRTASTHSADVHGAEADRTTGDVPVAPDGCPPRPARR